MSKTKQKILDTARKLFNKSGVASVTIRAIAQELGMSTGNLNYHFQKRDQILDNLYTKGIQDMFDLNELEDVLDLQIIADTLRKEQSKMIAYQFFWQDLSQVYRESEYILKDYNELKIKRISHHVDILENLRENGILEEDDLINQDLMLATRMVDFVDSWIPMSISKGEKINQKTLFSAHRRYMAMLYPYLTEESKEDLRHIIES